MVSQDPDSAPADTRPSVLVTGASSGIGAATAVALVDANWQVWGTSRQPPATPESGGVRWLQMDVVDEASVNRGVDEILSASGSLAAVVCNAGYGIFGSVEEVSLADAQAQLDTNFFGVLRVLRAVLPAMRRQSSGRIVLVGSLAGRAPIPFQAHYSASKAAVEALALALHNEVRSLGIRVTLVEPGDINTPFNDAMNWASSPDDSVYGDALEECEAVIREALPKAPPPTVVAEAIRKALSARRPRVRYTVGPDSLMVPLGRRLLPDRLTLELIRRHFRLD